VKRSGFYQQMSQMKQIFFATENTEIHGKMSNDIYEITSGQIFLFDSFRVFP